MIVLHVRIEARAGRRDDLLAGAQEVARHSRNESGCIAYHFYEDTENEGTFAFFEHYADEAAFNAHRREPHFLSWRARMHDLISWRVAQVHYVERLETL